MITSIIDKLVDTFFLFIFGIFGILFVVLAWCIVLFSTLYYDILKRKKK